MNSKKLLVSIVLGAAVAGGVVSTSVPASAGSVTCGDIGKNIGNDFAYATDCDHRGQHSVRLYAECDWSPSASYSPWTFGDFNNRNFKTSDCNLGVESYGFRH
jgi:hypothetical protein